MAMLQRLVSVDFRSFSSHFSFASWADELHVQPKETALQILEVPPEEVSLEVPTPAPSERVPAAEDLCSLLDSVVDDELAEAIQRVEEALQEKDADGSLIITKNSGRNKLQNKLKRAKGRLAKMESKEPVLASVEDVGIVDSKIEEAIPEYEEHPTGSLDASKSIGAGCMDQHGYHGVDWLPSWADLSYRGWHKCRKFSHLFLSYPKSIQSPSEHWCTNINPTAFCSDFMEVISQPYKPRVLSCWGHSETRPGNRIPNMADGTRLWKIRPSEITFSQDSIGKKFTDGNSLDDTLEKLLSGDCKVEEIEKIKITWHAHPEKSPGIARWWTYTGNRRLSLYQTLEEQGHLQYIVAEWVNVPVPEWRMTTERPGDRPFVRR